MSRRTSKASAPETITIATFEGGALDTQRRRLQYPPPELFKVPDMATPSAWTVYRLWSCTSPRKSRAAAIYKAQSP